MGVSPLKYTRILDKVNLHVSSFISSNTTGGQRLGFYRNGVGSFFPLGLYFDLPLWNYINVKYIYFSFHILRSINSIVFEEIMHLIILFVRAPFRLLTAPALYDFSSPINSQFAGESDGFY